MKQRGSGMAKPLPRQQREKGPITAAPRVTPAASAQMGRHRLHLFRSELLIQIFPEADHDLFTFHSRHPQ